MFQKHDRSVIDCVTTNMKYTGLSVSGGATTHPDRWVPYPTGGLPSLPAVFLPSLPQRKAPPLCGDVRSIHTTHKYLRCNQQVAQLRQRNRSKLETISINVQSYSHNNARYCIFGPPYDGIRREALYVNVLTPH